jgi:hypothetical protein
VVIGAKGGENIVHKDRTQRGRSTKGEKMLFTKIDSKRGEIDKRRGSTKILSTQVGGASS